MMMTVDRIAEQVFCVMIKIIVNDDLYYHCDINYLFFYFQNQQVIKQSLQLI